MLNMYRFNAYMALYSLQIIIYIEIHPWYNFSDCIILILPETTKKPKVRQWTHSRPVFFHWNINCHLFMRVQERIITPFMFSLSCFSSSSSFLGIIHRYWIAHHNIRASHTHWAEVICWNPNEQKYKRFFLS